MRCSHDAGDDVDRLDHPRRHRRRLDRLRLRSTPASARKELGSEIELAANRKPYYDDEALEGQRLERVQLFGVLLLVVIVIGLPLYWVLEPTARPAPTEGSEKRLRRVGRAACSTPTADGGFNCAGCHGGMNATGGVAPYTVTDPVTGEVARRRTGCAPALNTVLLPLRRGRGPLHPHLRPARSRRCRRGASPAAAR